MEFLLQSDQQNRRWVNLREWLLMAARVLAVALAATMLAGPQVTGRLAALFADESTHHILLVDDSYSMAARAGGVSVWEELRGVTQDILTAASKSSRSRVSVVRVSDPSVVDTATGKAELESLSQRLKLVAPSESASDLTEVIEAATELAKQSGAAGPVVAYVLSDFRQRNLEPAGRFEEPLAALAEVASAVRLAACAPGPADNVAVTSLRLLPGPRVADLEVTAEVEVTNYGQRPVTATAAVTVEGQSLPAASLGELPPRESRTATFPVRFEGGGDHLLEVQLDSDTLDLDNRRLFAARLPMERRLLIVDGSAGGAEGLVFTAALRPAGVDTGWRPERMPTNRFKDAELAPYAAVLLLDVPDLPEEAAAKLAEYVAGGGGVLLTLGPSADRKFYNRTLLGEADPPLMPVTLGKPTQAPAGPLAEQRQSEGDVAVAAHPIFRVFEGDRNSFLQLLAINYYRNVELPEEPSRRPQVLATLRGEAPLMLDASEADRRVLCLLTTVARPKGVAEGWSNLGTSPVFPVLANEIAAHLTELRTAPPKLLVGQPWSAVSPSAPPTGFAKRGDAAGSRPVEDAPEAEASGYYTLLRSAGELGAELVAVNVDAAEGDLAGPTPEELAELVTTPGVSVDTPAQFRRAAQEEQSSDAGRWLGGVLLAVLVAEKLLAVQASYHGSAKGGAA